MRLQKVGIVLSVAILSAISFISGVNINNQANSAGSSSVLPVSKGGTGSNNAGGARTNLEVYSTAETDANLEKNIGWKSYTPNINANVTDFYVKLIDNVPLIAFTHAYSFDAYMREFNDFSTGKFYIRFSYASPGLRTINSAIFCGVSNYKGNYTNAAKYYVGVIKNSNDVYSLWLKQDSKVWLNILTSKKAVRFQDAYDGGGLVTVDMALSDATHDEPEGLEGSWVQVRRECENPPAPTPTSTP
jgi:hypothetical protein